MPVVLARRNAWLGVGWGLVLAVVWLSLSPKPIEIHVANFGDKIGHVLAYAGLMGWWSQLDGRHCRLALLFVLLGLGLEIAQGLTSYRAADVIDAAADSLGVGLGWLLTRFLPGWLGWIDRRLAP